MFCKIKPCGTTLRHKESPLYMLAMDLTSKCWTNKKEQDR